MEGDAFQHSVMVALAALCDGMKRLESAVECSERVDTLGYLQDAKDRRVRAEEQVMKIAEARGKAFQARARPTDIVQD